MKFQIIKTIDLSFLGEGWEGCNVKVSSISIKESREFAKMTISEDSSQSDQEKAADLMISVLKKKFISGTGWNGTEKVDIKANDLEDLPPQVMSAILTELTSGLTPNA